MTLDVLVVEDELDIADLISDVLKEEGFQTRIASCSKGAFDSIRARVPNAVILDLWLKGSELDGLGILEVIKEHYSLLPVVVISGHGTVETAITAIKLGAYDYITKPLSQKKLLITLKRACESAKLKKENRELKAQFKFGNEIIGSSSVVCKLKSEIEKFAPTNRRVLIRGSFGLEQDLVAKLVHSKSARAHGPMLIANAGSSKIERDLFGSKVSSKGPISRKLGMLEAAHKGSLYIQDVNLLDLNTQKALLEFINTSKSASEPLDVRIISSVAVDINPLVESGAFSRQLYERLSVCEIRVPQLRERLEDIPELVERYISHFTLAGGGSDLVFTKEALNLLSSYDWPANLKQLRNVVECCILKASASGVFKVDAQDLSGLLGSRSDDQIALDLFKMKIKDARREFEKRYIKFHMARFSNSISRTADFIGMERSALHRKFKSL